MFALDENFKQVTCFLWPKDMIQAPADQPEKALPVWGEGQGNLRAEFDGGRIKLTFDPAEGADIACYDIYRAMGDGEMTCIDGVKGRRFVDNLVLGGLRYQYYVRALDIRGRTSAPSNVVTIDMPKPEILEMGESTRV
jgi:hypothetical protein